MTKIMLVEDDNNLREIYEARLTAEGYDVTSAPDGEAALALAGSERPDLIITDVMMPKISGFEMLDILRNTEALRDVKVIMLTALGQAEDNARAGALGADRYLVKSQVTLEDIVKAAKDVLASSDTGTPPDLTVAPPANPAPAGAADTAAPSLNDAAAPPADSQTTDQPAADTPAATPVQPAVAAPSSDDDTSPVTPPVPQAAEPVQQDPAAAAQDAATIAAPAEQEESDMRSKIESFLDNPPLPQSDSAGTPAGDSVPDEADTEYDKDDQAPDQGIFAVQRETDAADQPGTPPAPGDVELPPVQTPATPPAPQAAADSPAQPDTPPSGTAAPAGTSTPEPASHAAISGSSRIIQPLDNQRPDINQLLALEEAKTAAAQASGSVQPAPAGAAPPAAAPASEAPSVQTPQNPPAPTDATDAPSQPGQPHRPIDPNSISL